jgi:phenylacetate-CoA ligase
VTADERLRWTVEHARNGSAWFRALLARAGVAPGDVRGVGDLAALPFTTKADLRAAGPLGWNCVPADRVVRVHGSSGTTGQRVVVTYTRADLDDWTDQFARAYRYAGVTAADRVQITPGYGLWTAGAGFQAGAEAVGAMAVPTGPGQVDLQFDLARDLGTTVLCATSSFALLLGEEAHRRGVAGELAWTRGILGSERWSEATRARIEALLGIETFDVYGMTELYGPGVGIEGPDHDGIHLWDDYYLVEVVEPGGDRVLPAGEQGEIVVTTLRKEGTPLLRYRTGDLSRLLPAAGHPHPRIARLAGRCDDMVKVRGVALLPAQIDGALAQVDGAGAEYQIHVSRTGGRDELLVRVESAAADPSPALAGAVREAVRRAVGLRVDVDVVGPGALPRSERKTRRVFDTRS